MASGGGFERHLNLHLATARDRYALGVELERIVAALDGKVVLARVEAQRPARAGIRHLNFLPALADGHLHVLAQLLVDLDHQRPLAEGEVQNDRQQQEHDQAPAGA